MDDAVQLVYDEKSGCFMKKRVPYMIIEVATKEEFEFLQKAIKFYEENHKEDV